MDPEAVAIRLPKLTKGPADLKGLQPVVVFTEQGMTGADLERLELPDRPGKSPGLKHQIEDIVVILDRSGSMKHGVSHTDFTPKLAHAQEAIGKLQSDFFPDARITLISFGDDATSVHVSDTGEVAKLQRAISDVKPGGYTAFNEAFKAAEKALNITPDSPRTSRSAIIFITDGDSTDDWNESLERAAEFRANNVATFLIGVGTGYNQLKLAQIAKKFGFCGWGHTPMEDGQNAFELLIPAFLQEVQSNDYYLQVVAGDDVQDFTVITPAIHESDQKVGFVGYQGEGRLLGFVDEKINPELMLGVGGHASDPTPHGKEIPVHDLADAGPLFEKTGEAKDIVVSFLVTRAALTGDREALEELAEEHPDLKEEIDVLLENMGRYDDVAIGQTMTSIAGWGSRSQTQIFTGQLSRQPGLQGGRKISPHSGGIGPLDAPVPSSLPTLAHIDPEAYQDLVPAGHRKLQIHTLGQYKEYDLERLQDGHAIVVGSDSTCHIQVNSAHVSRRHVLIRRDGDDFYISNLNSTNGTEVNGTTIDEEVQLSKGDEIVIPRLKLVFIE